MKKQFFAIIGLIFAGLIILAVIIFVDTSDAEVEIETPAQSFFLQGLGDINSVTLSNEYGSFGFEMGEESWENLQGIHLNTQFQNFLDNISSGGGFAVDFLIETDDLEQFGLNPPRIVLNLSQNGENYELYVGGQTVHQTFYALMAGSNEVYTIPQFIGNWLNSSVDAMVSREIYAFEPSFLIYIMLSRLDSTDILIVPNYVAGLDAGFHQHIALTSGLMMLEPISSREVDAFAAFDFANAVQNLQLGEVVSLSIDNLVDFGLDTPIFELSFDFFDPDNGVYNHTQMPVSVSRFRVGDTGEPHYYILYSGINHIFKINRQVIDNLFNVDAFDLIDRHIHNIPLNLITSVTIEYEGERYVVEVDIDDYDINISINGTAILEEDFEAFADFYRALSEKTYEHIVLPFEPDTNPEITIFWEFDTNFSIDISLESRFYAFDAMFYTIKQTRVRPVGEISDEYAQFLINRTLVNNILNLLREF